MSMIMCKYGCMSDTDEFVEFGYDEETCEYTCESCLESEEEYYENITSEELL